VHDVVDQLLSKAARMLRCGEVRQTLDLLGEAIERFPADPRARQMRGCLLHKTGEFEEAIADLELARAAGCSCATSELALADCYRRRGERSRCLSLVMRFVDEEKSCIGILSQAACQLGAIGEYSSALVVCEQIVERQPDAHQAWFGAAYYRARLAFNVPQIAPCIDKARNLEPSSSLYALNQSLLDLAGGRVARGWRILEAIHPMHFRCPTVIKTVAELYERHGQADRAAVWQERLGDLVKAGEVAKDNRRHAHPACCLALPDDLLPLRLPCPRR